MRTNARQKYPSPLPLHLLTRSDDGCLFHVVRTVDPAEKAGAPPDAPARVSVAV